LLDKERKLRAEQDEKAALERML